MDKKDFKVGQNIYLKIIEGSNAARRITNKSDINEWIVEKVVTKIGNKYITVADEENSNWGEYKFDIQNDFCHVYTYGGQDYELHLSRESIIESIEAERLYREIKDKFSNWHNKGKYSLEQLQKAKRILG